MKQFLIIGTLNAVTYKDVFPSIKRGEVQFGEGKNLDFYLPDGGVEKFGNIRWFTNIGVNNKKPFELTAKYSPEVYKKFDNYDAINVGRVKNIPCDYDGFLGVPLTFLDKHCPEQFELFTIACGNSYKNYPETLKKLGFNPNVKPNSFTLGNPVLNGKTLFPRLIIKKRR